MSTNFIKSIIQFNETRDEECDHFILLLCADDTLNNFLGYSSTSDDPVICMKKFNQDGDYFMNNDLWQFLGAKSFGAFVLIFRLKN